jgi:hypothetical protein
LVAGLLVLAALLLYRDTLSSMVFRLVALSYRSAHGAIVVRSVLARLAQADRASCSRATR